MAKFTCVCGYTISTSGDIPHPYQWNLIADSVFDDPSDSVAVDQLYMQATVMFRCPRSGHLWIYWDGLGVPPALYSPGPAVDV
jgi:hypothetical protein